MEAHRCRCKDMPHAVARPGLSLCSPSEEEGERGPYLPLLLYGFNEIIYLEGTPGAAKGISDVSYI